MNTTIVFCLAIYCIAMAVCAVFLGASIVDLRRCVKADKQLFGVILNKENEIVNHCNKVMQLMDGTIDMLRKEHDLHNQAVDAMNDLEQIAKGMEGSFAAVKHELDITRNSINKLNNRLDEFDALKYLYSPATTTPYTLVNTAAETNSDIAKQFSSLATATAKTTESEE